MVEIDREKLFSVKEVAKKIGVTERTIRRWISERKLPAYKIGFRVYVAKEDVQKMIQRIN